MIIKVKYSGIVMIDKTSYINELCEILFEVIHGYESSKNKEQNRI
jgi:hypothetical protein